MDKTPIDQTKPIPPMTERMMQFFSYKHLPEHLQDTSKPFCELANWILENVPQNPERTVALRKLLEAKDCAVRAMVYLALVILIVLVPRSAVAQATDVDYLVFGQAAPSLSEAQRAIFKYYPDGNLVGTALVNVVCSGAVAPYTCKVLFPQFTSGAHSLMLTASNEAGESGKSVVFNFTFVTTLASPISIHIEKANGTTVTDVKITTSPNNRVTITSSPKPKQPTRFVPGTTIIQPPTDILRKPSGPEERK